MYLQIVHMHEVQLSKGKRLDNGLIFQITVSMQLRILLPQKAERQPGRIFQESIIVNYIITINFTVCMDRAKMLWQKLK